MKKVILYALCGLVLLIVFVLSYLKLALPSIPLREDIKVELTEENVLRGEYLANSVAVCIDCHSIRDWTLFSAPPKKGTFGGGGEVFNQQMGLPGVYYSKNITPARIGDWSDAEIFRAITSGVSKAGNALFPIMPHPNYGNTSKEDIVSIIAYLRSLEPIEKEITASSSDFPMNFIINTIPQEPNFSGKPDDSTDPVIKGKYLATMASCKDCHTPFEKGAYDESMLLAGGRSFPMPGGRLTSPNLTPEPNTGLGNWTKDQFVQRFKMYQDSAYQLPKINPGEFNSIMPWVMYSTMKEEDLEAIFTYLQSLSPIENDVVRWVPEKE